MSNKIKPAIITFPGSNCERDMEQVLRRRYKLDPCFIGHREVVIPEHITHVFLPGGFSFGDYLRAGALAAASPIMNSVREFANSGKPVMGVCNGFQILCEARLLPGTLLRNHHDRFVCTTLPMTWSGARLPAKKKTLRLPIAHREGRYFADRATLETLKNRDHIILSYEQRDFDGRAEINGAMEGIAGIIGGVSRNIIGLMPHPERMASLVSDDGALILDDFIFG